MINRRTWEDWRDTACSLEDAIPYMVSKYRAEGMSEDAIANILRLCSRLRGNVLGVPETPRGVDNGQSISAMAHGSDADAGIDCGLRQPTTTAAPPNDKARSSIAASTSTGPPSPANLHRGVMPSKYMPREASKPAGVPSQTTLGPVFNYGSIDTGVEFEFGANELDEI